MQTTPLERGSCEVREDIESNEESIIALGLYVALINDSLEREEVTASCLCCIRRGGQADQGMADTKTESRVLFLWEEKAETWIQGAKSEPKISA